MITSIALIADFVMYLNQFIERYKWRQQIRTRAIYDPFIGRKSIIDCVQRPSVKESAYYMAASYHA